MAKTKRKRKKRHDSLVLQLMILVAVVLVVFEGRLVVTMITHRSSMKSTTVTDSTAAAAVRDGTLQTQASAAAATPNGDTVLAGLPTVIASSAAAAATPETQAEPHATTSDPSSPAIVPKAATPVDDSYFKDAVFIGDSRMQGFQNASGITQGTFFTSVGMSLSAMQSEAVIRTTEGNITVAAALSGNKYNKVYIMLGANDLGEYDWNSFQDGFTSCLQRFQEIQPDAIFYICSVIYVEESKVEGGAYVNNTNVDKINSILLKVCEEQGYHYLDLNEVLSNGYGSLIEGASSDGVHIYEKYCKMMLDYLKNHYVTADTSDTKSESSTETETESETETSDAGAA
ncbi:MAG: hypothetical protein KHW67_10220 [Lachnospiraceae bacterium]|nr:hypothetical protein [Lachnospiraceae bacterium]